MPHYLPRRPSGARRTLPKAAGPRRRAPARNSGINTAAGAVLEPQPDEHATHGSRALPQDGATNRSAGARRGSLGRGKKQKEDVDILWTRCVYTRLLAAILLGFGYNLF
jgi:hypothetical protein